MFEAVWTIRLTRPPMDDDISDGEGHAERACVRGAGACRGRWSSRIDDRGRVGATGYPSAAGGAPSGPVGAARATII
jgi:hypothetical protein